MLGYVKLYRNLLENPLVCKDSDHFAAYHYLILNATHKERRMIFRGKTITLKPGQLITGRKKIAEKFKIHESKVQRILGLVKRLRFRSSYRLTVNVIRNQSRLGGTTVKT